MYTLYSTIVYYTVLYYTILYYTIPYYTILKVAAGPSCAARRLEVRGGGSCYYNYVYDECVCVCVLKCY